MLIRKCCFRMRTRPITKDCPRMDIYIYFLTIFFLKDRLRALKKTIQKLLVLIRFYLNEASRLTRTDLTIHICSVWPIRDVISLFSYSCNNVKFIKKLVGTPQI